LVCESFGCNALTPGFDSFRGAADVSVAAAVSS